MKDRRLYMTFPNDFHHHPKIRRLPVEVRWTFVEMVGEARLADNDGVFAAEDAEFLWPQAHLDQLVASHPTRPLVVFESGSYLIREYAKHQQTRAERESLSRKRSDAGRRGGKSQASAKQVLRNAKQTEAESESESEIPTYLRLQRQSSSNRAREDETQKFSSEIVERLASQAGITDPSMLARVIRDRLGITVEWDHLPAIVRHLADKSKSPVKSGQAYAVTCITDTPEEVRQFIYENGFAA